MRLGAPIYTWGEVAPSNLYTIGTDPAKDQLPPVFQIQPSPPDNLYHALEDPAIAPTIAPAPAAPAEPAATVVAAKPSIAPVVWYAAGALALKLLIFS